MMGRVGPLPYTTMTLVESMVPMFFSWAYQVLSLSAETRVTPEYCQVWFHYYNQKSKSQTTKIKDSQGRELQLAESQALHA